MKSKFIFLLLLMSFSFSQNRYEKAMEKGLEIFNNAQSREEFIKSSNLFYRIYQAKKDSWLASYYYSFSNIRISMMEKESFVKDEYLDKALNIVSEFDSVAVLSLDSLAKSEIYTLKAMIYSAKIMIDPMTRGRELGPVSADMIQQAINYFNGNPRPYLINGQMKFYTPAAFGGGVEKAMPMLEESVKYFNAFEAQKFWPNWGKDEAEKMYEQCKVALQSKK